MSEGLLLRFALWTARRNGRALARSVGSQYEAVLRPDSTLPQAQRWQRLLDHRPGWRQVRPFVYVFRTGERVELKAQANALELLDWVAFVELQPLSRGFGPALQTRLLKESVQAARAHWEATAKAAA